MKGRLSRNEWLLVAIAQAVGTVCLFGAAPRITPDVLFQQNGVNLEQTNVFTVKATGDAPLSYQWRFENQNLPGETNNSLTIRNAQPPHEGDYSVVITNAFGAITSSPTRLYVTPRQTDFIKDNFTNTARLRLPYFYLLPAGYDPARKYPLYYWLHGIPGDETMITKPGYGYPGYGSYAALKAFASFRQQTNDPVIFVWPARRAGDANGDWTSQYMQLLSQLLDRLLIQFNIDTNRIYVDGASGGMHAVWDLLGMRPSFFAGARMSAGWQGDHTAAAIKNTPMWIWCAADDGLAQGTRAAVLALRTAGGNPVYTEYRTGGHMNGIGIGMLTPVINEWLLSQRKGQSCTNDPLLVITSCDPAADRTARTTLDLAGIANALGEAVTNVWWTNYANNVKAAATGSNVWVATGIPLAPNRTNVIVVAGTTTSWASAYGGSTTFNGALRVACYPINARLAWQGTNAVLSWTGGGPPYLVERATDLAASNWKEFLSKATPPLNLPLESGPAFYRVGGQ